MHSYTPQMEANLHAGWRDGLRRCWGPLMHSHVQGSSPPWRTLENTRFWPPSATQLSSVAVLGFGIAMLTDGIVP